MTPSLLRMPSPIGRLELSGDGDVVTAVLVERGGVLPRDSEPERPDRILTRAARQLDQYFAGRRTRFDVPMARAGTAFQRAVWDGLLETGFGATISYGALGRRAGFPTAGRAVGRAIGANPLPLLVPCHRVLGSDGRITGYSVGEGIVTKRWLLGHEGVLLAGVA